MINRVLRLTTITSFWMMVLVVISCAFLPKLHEYELRRQQERLEDAALLEKLESLTGLEILDYNNAESDEGGISFPGEIRIALPAGVQATDVEITNTYVTQTVTLLIPDADEYYMYLYPMIGKSDHIANLQYESEDNTGILEITMDAVYELEESHDENYIYLDFISPHEIYDKVVVIDAGHGGDAPGAIKGGIMEKDITLAITLQLQQIFEEAGDESIGVYYTRTDDTNPAFENRVGLANGADADVFISIHCNSTGSGKSSTYSGTVVLYDETSEVEELGSKQLAEICVNTVSDTIGSRNRGITDGSSIYIIRTAEVPVALIEAGFMTNKDELERLTSEDYQKQIAQGIYNSIMEAFEEGF